MGKNGQRRKLEVCFMPAMISHLRRYMLILHRPLQLIMGRQKLKKSLQYEIKWRGELLIPIRTSEVD